jgi:hypothetical protein
MTAPPAPHNPPRRPPTHGGKKGPMTTEYPDTITTTPERISVLFGAAPDGSVSVQLLAECPPPVGTLRLILAPGQPGALYDALSKFLSLTDEQYDQVAKLARDRQETEENQ